MNAKQAKKLRAQAQAQTIGQANVAYENYLPRVETPLPNGKIHVTPGIPRVLNPDCTRAIYKKLKKLL